jgi:hypothetical protein
MRPFILAAVLALPISAQPVLYACANLTRDYVVGAKLPPSGLFRRAPDGAWKHSGFIHPFLVTVEPDLRQPPAVLLAAGNGLIRAIGDQWTILTAGDVTELRDLALDTHAPGTIYFAHSAGIRVTHDSGVTWKELAAPLRRKYTEAIRVDRRQSGILVAGGEQGIFRSGDGGQTWQLAGAAGFQIMRIEQSPHDPCYWLAATQAGGLFVSRDCALTFESNGRLGAGANLYDIAFDPTSPGRIAVAGWGFGAAVSTDNGKTWQVRNTGLSRPDVTSIVFDPARPGRMFAAAHEDAVYVSDDSGLTWHKDGLEGSHVNRLRFVGERGKP